MLPRVGMGRFELPKTSCLSYRRSKPTELHPDEASPVPTYIRNGPQGDRLHTHIFKTHVISHSALYIGFHPKGIYRFNLLGLEIAAILPRLVVTAISDGLVIIII